MKWKDKFALAFFMIAFGLIMVFDAALLKYYTDLIGFGAGLMGRIITFMGVISVFNNIWGGIFVDRKKKYKKFLRYTIILGPILPVLLLMVQPDWNRTFSIILITIVLFFWDVIKLMFNLNYGALFFNVTESADDRTSVSALRNTLGLISSGASSLIPVIFLTGEYSLTTVRFVFLGVIATGAILAQVCFAMLDKLKETNQIETHPLSFSDFFMTLKTFLTKKTYLFFLLGILFIGAPMNTYFIVYIYYMDNILGVSGFQATLPDILGALVQVAIYSSIIFLARKYGARDILRVAVLVSVACLITLFLTSSYWVAALAYILFMIGGASFWTLHTTMLGTLIDYDELETGIRKPALLSSVLTLVLVPGASLVTLIFTGFLEIGGYDGSVKIQSEEAVRMMRLGGNAIPAILMTLGVLFLSLYPLNRKKELEIADSLKTKKSEKKSAIS